MIDNCDLILTFSLSFITMGLIVGARSVFLKFVVSKSKRDKL